MKKDAKAKYGKNYYRCEVTVIHNDRFMIKDKIEGEFFTKVEDAILATGWNRSAICRDYLGPQRRFERVQK